MKNESFLNKGNTIMQDRRSFFKILGGLSLAAAFGNIPMQLLAAKAEDYIKISVLSTNDVHSRIDPFPNTDKRNPGMAGFARRAAIIKNIRKKEDHVLLFDAGDIFQGTPYFNLYGGELELKLMSEMGYDAATMGNHDFDNGLEGFKKQLPHANFPFLTSNYDFSNTILSDQTQKWTTFQKGPIKIGVFGLGVKLEGLVSKNNYQETIYQDPILIGNKMADKLRAQGCHLIIAISHLGHSYKNKNVSDLVLAKESHNIDLIIGGHTHTFLDQPDEIINKNGNKVLVSQSGWGGILLGKIDFYFSKKDFSKISSINTKIKVKNQ
ncbi:MAG: metallophosphatase [Bacteroidales bacterium]|nr:metallophosphatase [Bacteroidales bacterium]